MERQKTAAWDEKQWVPEYQTLMEIARENFNPEWKYCEVVVLKTAKGTYFIAQIPNYQDATLREPLENQCIQKMQAEKDTEVFSCLATVNGKVPEVLSWNFLSQLAAINPENLHTKTFLWGGGDNIHVKPISALLPPKRP